MSQLQDILLIGGGGHCRSCIDVIEAQGRFRIRGIVENNAAAAAPVLGYPILGTDEDLPDLRRTIRSALVAIGQIRSHEPRKRLYNRLLALGFETPPIVSPHAIVSNHATIGPGTIVMHGAIVNAGAAVGVNSILNSTCLVEHDATIGDHCHISTGAIVNGGAAIGDNSFVGSHATVVQNIRVAPNSFLKANSLTCR